MTGAAAWLTVEAVGAALVTVEAACDTVAEAWLTVEPTVELTGEAAAELPAEPAVELPAEPAGAVTLETTPLTVLVTPVTVLVTAPSRPPPEPEADGVDDVGVARFVVAAWALEPDRSQQMAIRPRQQLASIRARSAIRPARLWPAATHASGTAYSTPLQPP